MLQICETRQEEWGGHVWEWKNVGCVYGWRPVGWSCGGGEGDKSGRLESKHAGL